jgi:hypothetical protein
MPIKIREAEQKIQGKFGFQLATERSSDHRWYKLRLEGLPVISTKFSHSKGDLSPMIEAKIARQLRVPRGYFLDMMACNKGPQEYYEQVRTNPVPPWDVGF